MFLAFLLTATLYFFLKAATIDPGFVPHQEEDAYEARNRQFFKNYLVVGGVHGQKTHAIKLAYCSVCNIYRPPRTEHCNECDVCVQVYDRHSLSLSNCIGKRNLGYCLWFAIVLFIDSLHIIV